MRAYEVDWSFLYFDGCANAEKTLDNLRSAIAAIDIEIEPRIVEVDTTRHQEAFEGSPSILVNGIDLYSQRKPEGHYFACRVFEVDGEASGVLSRDFIKTRLLEMIDQEI